MAGGGASGGVHSRELDRTPTWAVALVTVVIIIISIFIEKVLHKVTETFRKRKKFSLVEAVEKIKAELMILGFISLLLTFGQSYIASICLPIKAVNNMWPCDLHYLQAEVTGQEEAAAPAATEGHHRRLLYQRRVLAGGSSAKECPAGKVALISQNGLHQLHVFIFFLAVFHVFYGSMTMMLGRLKIRGWKDWEEKIQEETAASNDPSRFRLTHETSFVKSHSKSGGMDNPIFFYSACFFRHMLYSVQKADYLTLRHAFVSVHLSPGTKFNFQKYIKRSLEDDFKVIVGIPPYLWLVTVIYQLLNLEGGRVMFYMSIMSMLLLLSVGTKLQSIITRMAIEIQEKHAVVQGIPLVQVTDRHFWFSNPKLVLILIHVALFQNSFEITHFMWIWYEFGLHSCFHHDLHLATIRLVIGIVLQFICSYITLPLYALVTQMGSHMKKSIFDEHTSKALMSWHHKIKHKGGSVETAQRVKKLGGGEDNSPEHSPLRSATSDLEMTESANMTAQVDIPPDANPVMKDLLSSP